MPESPDFDQIARGGLDLATMGLILAVIGILLTGAGVIIMMTAFRR